MKKSVFAALSLITAATMTMGAFPVFGQELTNIDTSIPVQSGMRVAVVSKTTKGQFWTMVRQGMDAAINAVNESYGYSKKADKVIMTFEGPSDESLVEEQINTLDAVIAENPDVICISAGDMQSCQAQLESAIENGIPVIVFDSNVVDSDLVTAFRATDNLEVGRIAGTELATALDGAGEILIFSAQEKTESIQHRVAGFQEVMEEYPDILLDDILYADQVDNLQNAMKEALEAHPDVKAVFCTNADSSDWYLGLDSKLREGILMVGVDATTKQQEAIKNGEEICVVSQDPRTLGYETIITAVYAAMMDMVEVEITPTLLLAPQKIDANNIYNPQYVNYLYSEKS